MKSITVLTGEMITPALHGPGRPGKPLHVLFSPLISARLADPFHSRGNGTSKFLSLEEAKSGPGRFSGTKSDVLTAVLCHGLTTNGFMT